MRNTRLALIGALLIASCAAPDPTPAAPTAAPDPSNPAPSPTTTAAAAESEFPVVVVAANGSVEIGLAPSRIVSLSPTATEMLFAVGAGESVVAVDEFSYYPAEAPVTELSGFTPNLEAIVSYEPDLVVVSDDIDGIVGSLEAVDITVLHLAAAATFDDVVDQIEIIGLATGHAPESEALARELQQRVDGIVATSPAGQSIVTYYHELDPSFYSFTSSTFIGEMYGLLGLTSIADAADDGFGYPQLSAEYILDSDPDLIVIDDCCGETLESIAGRPGWSSLSAVQSGAVLVVDADEASRWGPRIVDFLESIAAAITTLEGSSG